MATKKKTMKKKVSTECKKRGPKPKIKNTPTECSEAPKRKRGRPRKNPEKVSTECADEVKRGRGRPKKVSTECEVDMSNVRTYKLLGWCPEDECKGFITNGDIEEGEVTIIICPRCGVRHKTSDLTTRDKKGSDRSDNRVRKEFLNEVNNDHIEELSTLHESDIPKEYHGYSITDEEWD